MAAITKEHFLDIINKLRDTINFDAECEKLAREHNIEFFYPATSVLSGVVTDLLDIIFGDFNRRFGGDVNYFVFELNFGADWKPGMITDKDAYGNEVDVDFSNAEKLWDYLTAKKTECE